MEPLPKTRTGLLPQIAEPLRARALQHRGTCVSPGSSIFRSAMSIPENRPPRVVLVHLPGSPGRKHAEASKLPFISQTARLPSCHGPVLVPTQASRSGLPGLDRALITEVKKVDQVFNI